MQVADGVRVGTNVCKKKKNTQRKGRKREAKTFLIACGLKAIETFIKKIQYKEI